MARAKFSGGAARSERRSREKYPLLILLGRRGGLMVSALDSGPSGPGSSPVGDTALCSWARHLTPTVPLSTQVYKWVPANCWGNLTNCGEVTCDGLTSRPGEVEILLAASCYGNRDKLRQLWANLSSKASLFHSPRGFAASLSARPPKLYSLWAYNTASYAGYNLFPCLSLSVRLAALPFNNRVQLSDTVLEEVKEFKDLGILTNDGLCWNSHIDMIIAYQTLGSIFARQWHGIIFLFWAF